MDYKFFLQRITSIILNPVKSWDTIYSGNIPVKVIRNSFLIPLLILVSVSAFAGSLIFSNAELNWIYSIFVGIKCFLLLFFTIYSTSFIFGEITYPLDLGKDFRISFNIITYSAVPFLLCQILSGIFESLLFINIIGFYGLYIFWTGIEKILKPAQHKKMPMVIATTICLLGIYIVTNLLLGKLVDKIYFSYFA